MKKFFSKYLSDYIKEKNLSWREAAKLCDVERTLLSRYASGEKSPKSVETVLKIAGGLGMSGRQTEEFKTLYEISRAGEFQYLALKLIWQIFCGQDIRYHGLSLIPKQPDGRRQEDSVNCLHGREEICRAAFYLVQDASYLRIKMNSHEDNGCLFSIISDSNPNCRIEHIIEINHVDDREMEVGEFGNLFSVLLSGLDYNVYCYDQWGREKTKSEEAMYMMLSNKRLLLFTSDMTRGCFTGCTEYREYYEEIFLDDLRKCRIFGKSKNGFFEPSDDSEGCRYLENPTSGISFIYKDIPYESIWVRKNGEVPLGFCLEEVQFVKMFKSFMECSEKISMQLFYDDR